MELKIAESMEVDNTYRINLVSLKILIFGQNSLQNNNIDYSIFGHTFFGCNSAVFCPIGKKFFTVTQETIIYWLVVKNHAFNACLREFLSRPDQKVGPMSWPLRSTVISKTCIRNFRAWNPQITQRHYLRIQIFHLSLHILLIYSDILFQGKGDLTLNPFFIRYFQNWYQQYVNTESITQKFNTLIFYI